jgi:transcriptional repressor NrdR
MLAQKVEETIRQTGASQIDANDIGLAILPPLRELDEVAFLRFASVYQAFDSLEDFESAIGQLRSEHLAGREAGPREGGEDGARGGEPGDDDAGTSTSTSTSTSTKTGANTDAVASEL